MFEILRGALSLFINLLNNFAVVNHFLLEERANDGMYPALFPVLVPLPANKCKPLFSPHSGYVDFCDVHSKRSYSYYAGVFFYLADVYHADSNAFVDGLYFRDDFRHRFMMTALTAVLRSSSRVRCGSEQFPVT